MNATTQAPSARDRILLAAHELFYKDGIRATGIDRVIAESGVTKVTFYRHFPSKNDLIREFLEYRHRRWMHWFEDALVRNGYSIRALVPALREWLGSETFRGCAFINSVGELGETLPEVLEISRRHKREMTEVVRRLLPASRHAQEDAEAIALAIDGAIVRAQFDHSAEPSLKALARLLKLINPG